MRDLPGYGKEPPRVEWPGSAMLAVSLVVNFEEGAEFSVEQVLDQVHRIDDFEADTHQSLRDAWIDVLDGDAAVVRSDLGQNAAAGRLPPRLHLSRVSSFHPPPSMTEKTTSSEP